MEINIILLQVLEQRGLKGVMLGFSHRLQWQTFHTILDNEGRQNFTWISLG